jgi:hypothetical protein
MSRANPTPAELSVGGALSTHLQAAGHVLTGLRIEDRPDLRVFVDGQLTGFELVQVPPRKVMELVHTRFKQLNGAGAAVIRVVWPQEPHLWVENAIREKHSKLGAYRRNLGSERVSLLIHTPVGLKEPLVRVGNPAVMSLIRSAATHTPNDFDAIYFYDAELGIERLTPNEPPWPKTSVVFDGGYPTDGFLMGTAPFTTTKEGEPPRVHDFGIIEPRVLLVPPQSPEFRKHKPKYKNPKLHVTITVGSTDARISFQVVEE